MLLKNVILIDDTNEYNLQEVDIRIKEGIIEEIGIHLDEKNEKDSVNLSGNYVSPGWIDLHVHCFQNTTDISVDADKVGVDQGVVMVCDAGSSGESNLEEFYHQNKDKETIVKAWINIASTGLKDRHELKDPDNVNVEKTIQRIKEYQDLIVGIKVRASASVMGEDTQTPFDKAKEVKHKTDLPIMVHIGNFPPTIEEVLANLDEDDVITHCFHGKPNGIISDNKIKPIVLDKRKKGVKYDVGHGQESFSYSVAKAAKGLGFDPDSISSDLHKYNIDGPVYSLANVVTKFLNLGYSLNQVIHYVTLGPAQLIKESNMGQIKVGQNATLTLFTINHQQEKLVDSMGEEINVEKIISPTYTLINGRLRRTAHGK